MMLFACLLCAVFVTVLLVLTVQPVLWTPSARSILAKVVQGRFAAVTSLAAQH